MERRRDHGFVWTHRHDAEHDASTTSITRRYKLTLLQRQNDASGPSRQAAFFGPTVANGALRAWPDLQLARPGRDAHAAIAGRHR
jgi:hypothetical protein